MKRLLIYICFFIACFVSAQQTNQYSQFILNRYAYNPAAAGTSFKGGPIDVMIGTRRQWLDIDNAPRDNFAFFNYTFIPKRSYRKWHNVGAFVDQTHAGVFVNNSFYLSYSFHLILTKKLTASVGFFAGVKRFQLSINSLDRNDPAVQKSSYQLWSYPDIIPGIRLYSKKTFIDISVRQLTTTSQSGQNKQIGNKSKLVPHIYFTAGRKFWLENDLLLTGAVNVRSTLTSIPSLEGCVMLSRPNIAIGISARDNNFICGILQVRFLKNAVVGFAYDYSISRVRLAAPNTLEVILGFTPIEARDRFTKSSNVAKCPTLDF
jgi:type IX secretion system PorP/SprF family membrane protein